MHVQRFEREALAGFVNPATYVTPAGVELFQLSGTVVLVPYPELKAVHFVRDFQVGESLSLWF